MDSTPKAAVEFDGRFVVEGMIVKIFGKLEMRTLKSARNIPITT